jgi:hypothetical protein
MRYKNKNKDEINTGKKKTEKKKKKKKIKNEEEKTHPQSSLQQALARPQHASHPESDVQPLVPPMPMPPMLGSGHYFFLLEVKVEVEEGVPGVRVSGVLR